MDGKSLVHPAKKLAQMRDPFSEICSERKGYYAGLKEILAMA